MEKIVLVAALRSPIGKLGGALKEEGALDLLTYLGQEMLKQVPSLDRTKIDALFLGQVLQAGHGQNLARQLSRRLAIHPQAPCYLVNFLCGSGLQSVLLAIQNLKLHQSYACLVGGVELMSQAPYLMNRNAPTEPVDSLTLDALTDGLDHFSMLHTAEKVAKTHHISKEAQDAFSLQSHIKATQAYARGAFKEEICPLPLPLNSDTSSFLFEEDETLRKQLTLEQIQKLNPLLEKGSVTAASSSSLNDGACLLLLMRESDALKEGLSPLLILNDFAYGACDPEEMGFAPYDAITRLLEKTGKSIEDFDLFELTEAFASQVLAVAQALNLPIEKLNVDGGSLALGHPLAVSGARLVLSAYHRLKQHQKKTALLSLCIGGGQSIALAVEKYEPYTKK